jgi:hypothetical protein
MIVGQRIGADNDTGIRQYENGGEQQDGARAEDDLAHFVARNRSIAAGRLVSLRPYSGIHGS